MNKLDPARLDAAFLDALEHPEIAPHVGETIGRGTLQRLARESASSIWDAATEALNAEESARNDQQARTTYARERRNTEVRALIEKTDARPEDIAAVVYDKALVSGFAFAAGALQYVLPAPQSVASSKLLEIVAGVFGFVLILSGFGALGTLLFFLITGRGWSAYTALSWLPTTGIVALVSLVGVVVFSLSSEWLKGSAKRRAKTPTIKLLDQVQALLDQTSVEETSARALVDAATKRVEKELAAATVRFLRRAVDAAQADDYSTVLPDIIPRGLAEGYNVRAELVTPAGARLERYLESMPNGSIGIAGSRGAGKSTLLHTFAARHAIKRRNENGDIDELGVFSVEVSAPVQYEARDFILHLFSSICVGVRKQFGDQQDISAPAETEPDAIRPWLPLLQEIARNLMNYTAAIAAVLLLVAILAAVSIAQSNATTIKTNVFANMGIKPVDLMLQALIWFAAALLLFFVRRYTAVTLASARGKAPPSRPPTTDDPILNAARENALMIRYQRSYSADWNVGASFAGLSAGVKQAQSLQEQRLTLPEIVARYREFVNLLAARFVVIVAIDELDKIASDDKAQQFLNDIKALFGIPNCFYLITVSDNAMSSFARRGLPIRDAFDSALDEIVRVEHMDLTDAQKLIAGRVIGLPIPYLALCYCYSGGLPRDLIRSCRDVFELADRPTRKEPRQLALIGHEIFCEDLASKVKGSITAISAQRKGVAATAVLDRLRLLQDQAEKKSVSLSDYPALSSLAVATKDSAEISGLTMDLASYLYYALTVLEIIHAHGNDSATWEASRKRRLFDDLAALRRYIGVDSVAAAAAITSLRAAEKFPLPAPPLTPAAPAT